MGDLRRIGCLSAMLAALSLAGCAESQLAVHAAKSAVGAADDPGEGGGASGVKVGRPYQVAGVWYYPKVQPDYDETGIASWYGREFHGKSTANGETYDMNALTAAHKTLPLPSRVRVTNLENGRSIVLRVNDRGPFAHGRIIDVSRRGAQLLGFDRAGTAKVRVTLVDGREDEILVAAREEMPALPRGSVAAESLPPPQGASAAPPQRNDRSIPVRVADAAPRPLRGAAAGTQLAAAGPNTVASTAATDEAVVRIVSVAPTQIFVQAGAFLRYDNANRLRARLASYGPSRVTTVMIDAQEFFRVRVGPIDAVADADRMLERLIAGGFPDARIVVD